MPGNASLNFYKQVFPKPTNWFASIKRFKTNTAEITKINNKMKNLWENFVRSKRRRYI